MDFKKEFFQRKIKQESENESYNNHFESYTASNNLNIKFEEVSYSDNEPEDEIESSLKAIINDESLEEPCQLNECKTIPLTKNLDDIELISNEQVCRLCAQPITGTEIFLYEDADLEQKITYTLPITMGLGDGLPEYICRNCEINLNMFYEFVCQVVNADKTIRQKMNPPDIKTNSVTNAIKEIFGTDEETTEDRVLEPQMQDNQLFEQETSEAYPLQDAQLFEKETSEGYSLQDDQLFEEETNEGSLEVSPLLLEEDLKKDVSNISEKRNKISSDDSFRPRKIRILNPKQYKCQLCKESFTDYFALAHHKTESHEKIRYSCPESDCKGIFFTPKALRQHINENHNVPVICYQCGKMFTTLAALEKHQDNFHIVKVCDSCGMSFKSLASFQMHRDLHEMVGKFQCPHCYRNFKNRHEIHRHTRQHHTGKFKLLVDMNEDDAMKNG